MRANNNAIGKTVSACSGVAGGVMFCPDAIERRTNKTLSYRDLVTESFEQSLPRFSALSQAIKSAVERTREAA